MNEQELRAYCDPGRMAKKWIDKYIAASALGVPPTLYATAAFTFKVLTEDIPGCLLECGACAAPHPGIMDYACRFVGKHREVWLLDSFEGIPMAGPEDCDSCAALVGRRLGSKIVTSGISFCTLRGAQGNMARWGSDVDKLHFVKGWFEETVPTLKTGPIAILRLDADLYDSTKVCMKYLYEKVVDGGFVIIDDWGFSGVQKAIREIIGEPPQLIKIPGTECWFWRKGRHV